MRKEIGWLFFLFAACLCISFFYILSIGGVNNPQQAVEISFALIESIGVWGVIADVVIVGGLYYFFFNRRKEQSDLSESE